MAERVKGSTGTEAIVTGVHLTEVEITPRDTKIEAKSTTVELDLTQATETPRKEVAGSETTRMTDLLANMTTGEIKTTFTTIDAV